MRIPRRRGGDTSTGRSQLSHSGLILCGQAASRRPAVLGPTYADWSRGRAVALPYRAPASAWHAVRVSRNDEARALKASANLPQPAQGPSPISRHFTHWLDEVFRIPGTQIRFGLDPLLAVIPWAGATVATTLGCVVLIDALRLRVPLPVLIRMCTNYAINWGLGALPVIGPFFDAVWRSNVKNLALLRRTINNRDRARKASIAYWVSALVLVLGTVAAIIAIPVILLVWGISLLWQA